MEALIQGKKFGSREFWAGVAGGAAAGAIAGASVDMAIVTGGSSLVGGLGNIGGYGVGRALEKAFGSLLNNILLDPSKTIGKDVLITCSQKTGELSLAFAKKSSQIIKLFEEQGLNEAVTVLVDIMQDVCNPGCREDEVNQ